MSETTDTTTEEPSDDYLRNDPASTFEAHLFDAESVAEKGGGDGDESETPVMSLCERSTSYGPFHEVEGDEDGDLCDVCRSTVEAEVSDA